MLTTTQPRSARTLADIAGKYKTSNKLTDYVKPAQRVVNLQVSDEQRIAMRKKLLADAYRNRRLPKTLDQTQA